MTLKEALEMGHDDEDEGERENAVQVQEVDEVKGTT